MTRLTVLLALAALAWPGRARACKPATPATYAHTIDPTLVGVDQTPPQLAQPEVLKIEHFDHDDGGCASKCGGWDHGATLTNLATDDMSPPGTIGYRLTTVAGTEPPGGWWQNPIVGQGDGTMLLLWGGEGDFDFTLQVIAIDAAGNESAPRTVRIHDDDDAGGCSVARRRARGGLTLLAAVIALVTRRRSSRAAPDRSRSRCP